MIFPVILGNQSKMEFLYQEKEFADLPTCALQQTPFLGTKFHFRLIPKDYREYHRYCCKKAGILLSFFSTREGRSAVHSA